MEQCRAVMTHPDNCRTHYGAVPGRDDTSRRQLADTLWSSGAVVQCSDAVVQCSGAECCGVVVVVVVAGQTIWPISSN